MTPRRQSTVIRMALFERRDGRWNLLTVVTKWQA
jgi:hypothetical protein